METPRPPARRARRLPAGLLGMLALVAACEGLEFRGDRYASDKAESWTFAARAATREAVGPDVLLLGDSMVKFGLLPALIEERSGGRLRAYNLAAFDAPPAAAEVILRRALKAGARPSAVVVDLMPHQLARPPLHPVLRRAWSELLTPTEAIGLAASLGRPDLPGLAAITRLVPSIRQREEIRAAILAELEGTDRSARNVVRLYRRNWAANRGAHVLPPRDEPGVVDAGNSDLFPGRFVPDPDAIASVRRLLTLARNRGVRTYWLISPLHPEAAARHEASGLAAAYDAEVRRLAAEFPELVVLDARRLGLEARRFADAVHLDRDGAAILSAAVADALSDPDGGHRRVILDRPTLPAGRLAVEDLDQSRTALLEARGARRR